MFCHVFFYTFIFGCVCVCTYIVHLMFEQKKRKCVKLSQVILHVFFVVVYFVCQHAHKRPHTFTFTHTQTLTTNEMGTQITKLDRFNGNKISLIQCSITSDYSVRPHSAIFLLSLKHNPNLQLLCIMPTQRNNLFYLRA